MWPNQMQGIKTVTSHRVTLEKKHGHFEFLLKGFWPGLYPKLTLWPWAIHITFLKNFSDMYM